MGERLHKLCPLCEKFQLRLRNRQHDWVFGHHSGSVPPYGPKRTHHRSLGALERSAQSGCHLCSLFAFAFKYNKTRYDLMTGPEVSHTDIRVGYRSNSEYNRQKDCEIQNHTQLGSLRVAWKDIELEFDIIPWPDSLSTIQLYREPISCSEYNRAQAPESLSKKKHGVVGIKPHLSCNCGKAIWEPNLLEKNQAAYISVDPLSPELRKSIDDWLETCRQKCNFDTSHLEQAPMPLRLIDVGETNSTKDPFLSVEPNRTGTYLTLSYRWFPNPFKADCSNLSALCEKIPLDNMPPTIKDAITFTRWLGVQYLWVDALCILQNKEDWLKQSPLMHEIYGNALLNISADAAVKPDIGFLRHRHPLHTHTCLLPSMIRLPDGTPLPAGICPSYPEAEKFPDKSILANRGWIMQERFLSQRRLHFGTNEILWECHEFQASERFPAPKFESDGNGADSEWVLPLKMGIGGRKDMWRDDPFEEWERIIGLYTRMHLTNQSDKLAAISGLVRELVNRTEKKLTYIAGLWKEVFITELLWEYDQDAPKLVRACVPAMKPDGPYRAPSFSWASVNYPTSFVYSPNEKALDDDEAVLVDWDITLADPENNPYGPVKDGWAQLNGYTISYSTLRNVKTPNYNKSNDRPLQLDKDWEDMPESAQRKVICLLVYIVDDTNCLALAPIDGPRGEKKYRRVGLFSASGEYLFQATRHLWSRRTVTVV